MVPGIQRLQRSQSAQGSYRVQRSKSHSAPVPLQLSVIREEDSVDQKDAEQIGELVQIIKKPNTAFSLWKTS